jgi:hypothetical protein
MIERILLLFIVVAFVEPFTVHAQGSGTLNSGQWTDADRAALERAWRSNDANETRRLQHKAWASGHQEEIIQFQRKMAGAQTHSNHQDTLDKVVIELACARKMVPFSGTPEYNRAVDACVANELPKYATDRRIQMNSQQQQLRKEYNFSPDGH